MKNLLHSLSCSLMFCACLMLFSCQKQISERITEHVAASMQSANTNECRAAVFAVSRHDLFPPFNEAWTTLAQKWYANGKVKYLKARHAVLTGTFVGPFFEPPFVLDWAEVSYQGNQVYLTDVINNKVVMRVTLDNNGRPAASYYDYEPNPGIYLHDTTYYYFDGDRLDYIISLWETTVFGRPTRGWYKYVLSYDSWGNLIKVEFPQRTRFNLQYDYTKPVNGLLSNFHLTSSMKLLEYMELIELPMHHAITRINFGTLSYPDTPDEIFVEVGRVQYKDYVITDGLVRSFVPEFSSIAITFYTGWECGASSPMNVRNTFNSIFDFKQFRELYPK